MLFGKPDRVKESKVDFYVAYLQDVKKFNEEEKAANVHDEEFEKGFDRDEAATEPMDDDTFFKVERIVQEYNTIKQVLINNAIPVDLAHIASGGAHKAQ